ncbi:MAG: RNA polymerase sigma factor, partial [Gemmatimonadaceae bacterium]
RRWRSDDTLASDPGAQMDAESELAVVRRELEALPAMQRSCFELVVLREVSVEDVAAMYAIAASTVRQHVFRARRELRTRLESLRRPLTDRWTRGESSER